MIHRRILTSLIFCNWGSYEGQSSLEDFLLTGHWLLFQVKMNGPVYASSCPALESNLSLHSSSYYSEYSGSTRRRLSSTGEADTSATSSYEGSDSSEHSDETRLDPVSQLEREQLETFFRGLKTQVRIDGSNSLRILSSDFSPYQWQNTPLFYPALQFIQN